ncbi:sensor histidine kinase [Emticicia agri]|uniref:histidine kinase n=1 Tax=Emticicia agri TaxID=2492393 RepID=A0A4Q5M095_9BACT|nr:sensor histidine kinase [Emticicia agri]RYU95213.1 sensor histidine kinase [Emticicia agri]
MKQQIDFVNCSFHEFYKILSVLFYKVFFLLLIGYVSFFLSSYQCFGQSKIEERKLTYAKDVYRDAILKKDSLLLAEAYYLLGKWEFNTKRSYLRSKMWYIKSLNILEKKPLIYESGRIHVRLSECEQSLGNYIQSFFHCYKAISIHQIINSQKGLIIAYVHLAKLHSYNWSTTNGITVATHLDSAVFYLNKAEALAKLTDDKEAIKQIGLDKGQIHLEDFDNYAKAGYKQLDSEPEEDKYTTLALATLHHFKAKLLNNNLEEAKLLLDKADRLFHEKCPLSMEVNILLQACNALYAVKRGDWINAYNYQVKLTELEKRKLSDDRASLLKLLGSANESSNQELLLEAQKQELVLQTENFKRQNNLFYIVVTLSLLLLGSAIVFYILFRKYRKVSNQNAVLVREQSHRLKNNLQALSDLLHLQSNRLKDSKVKQAVEEIQLRVEAMTTLHKLLYNGNQLAMVPLPDFLAEVAEIVLHSFDCKNVELSINIPDVYLTPTQALPLGLILNELTTNSCKYAFPNNPSPKYAINISIEKEILTMIIEDNGQTDFSEKVNLDKPKSFGLQLIQMQVMQLYGSYSLLFKKGMYFELSFQIR